MLQHTVAAVVDTRVWDGTPNPALIAWLGDDGHHFDGTQLVIHTTDGDIYPEPGWTIVRWPDGDLTVMSPRAAVKRLAPGAQATPSRAQTKLLGMVGQADPSIPPGTVELRPASETDSCRAVDIDGETIRVRGAGELTDQGRAALAEVVRAGKRRMAEEALTTDGSPLRDHIAEALHGADDPTGPWRTATPDVKDQYRKRAEAVLAVVLPLGKLLGGQLRDAEAVVQRVAALYDRWVQAGPPRLGTSISREWDRRLAELHNALHNPTKGTDHA